MSPTNKLSLRVTAQEEEEVKSLSCQNSHIVHLLPCGYRNCFPLAVKIPVSSLLPSFSLQDTIFIFVCSSSVTWGTLKKKNAVKRAM